MRTQVNNKAFSGGQQLAEDQRKYGADIDADIPYRWLFFFLDDDAELQQIHDVRLAPSPLAAGTTSR